MVIGEYATKYDQVRLVNPRTILRHSALSMLATFSRASGQMSSSLNRNRVQFLYLHHIFEDEEDSFRKLLQVLSQGHFFISYSEAVNRILGGNIDQPYISFSFDDGLKSCLRAAEIMNDFEAKACFFLCGSMVGETDYHQVKEFCLQRLFLPPVKLLSWDDVDTLLKAGHEIGSHTMTHPNLAQLSAEQTQREVSDSFQLLTERVGGVIPFSWPFGRFSHFSPTASRIVFETGYQSCASAERGCHVVQPETGLTGLCIKRDHVVAKWPVDHTLYFMARSGQRASIQSNLWPEKWSEAINPE